MTYFSKIEATNTRRFSNEAGDVLAIYDRTRAYTLYAPVGVDADGSVAFVAAPRSYFSDEVEELR